MDLKFSSDQDIGKHTVKALENCSERTDASRGYHREVQEVYSAVLNALPHLAKEADAPKPAYVSTVTAHRRAPLTIWRAYDLTSVAPCEIG
ncbi:hypothetical protein FRB99_006401 [Tulasnella sp. 403]|nr:hypothetical protein FRB99_006401 [Tulasnella sp. 403]